MLSNLKYQVIFMPSNNTLGVGGPLELLRCEQNHGGNREECLPPLAGQTCSTVTCTAVTLNMLVFIYCVHDHRTVISCISLKKPNVYK